MFWTAKKTNEWVLNKVGVDRELLNSVKSRKLTYYGHTMKEEGKSAFHPFWERDHARDIVRKGRPHTWLDNIKARRGLE